MNGWLTNFANKKILIADSLYSGKCNGSYSDALIILSSVISGISSELWPGHNIDRKRFVETIVRYTNPDSLSKNISTPMLIQHFKQQKDFEKAKILKNNKTCFDDLRVLTNFEIDYTEEYYIDMLPELNLKCIRNYSYCNLFYREVRSGLVHEYQASAKASLHPQTQRNVLVSYVNAINYPNHKIYFHYEWIKKIINQIVENLEKENINFPIEIPEKWWIDG